MFTENLEPLQNFISTENLEPLQSVISTYDVISFLDRDFLNEQSDSSGNETSTEKPDERVFFKWIKGTHPLWSYFFQTSDKKNIEYNLC
ncbi:12678_t:CDS:1, partial [Racocetra fulgida]